MAKTGTVTNVLRRADGSFEAGVIITARLIPDRGFRTDDSTEVTPPLPVTSSSIGAWSLQLEQNSNIWPAGTYWEITENLTDDQPRVWALAVGSGFQTLQAALTTPPTAGSTQISLAANNTWTGTNQFTGGVGFFGATPAGQQLTPVTLADVIAVLRAFGLVL